MEPLIIVLAVLAALGTGGAVGFVFRAVILGRRTSNAVAEASRIVEEAEEERKRAILEAKEEALTLRTQAEADLRERRSELLRRWPIIVTACAICVIWLAMIAGPLMKSRRATAGVLPARMMAGTSTATRVQRMAVWIMGGLLVSWWGRGRRW